VGIATSAYPCALNSGVLASIFAVANGPESPAVAFPSHQGELDPSSAQSGEPGASLSKNLVSISAGAEYPSGLIIRVTGTAKTYSWILRKGEYIIESGWARLQNHETSAAQVLQAISDASFFLPARSPVTIQMESKTVLRAIREDHLPNSRLGGLWRQVREQLADHQVEVSEISKDDPEYRQNLKLLQEAESRDALPVAVEGAGWLRFSTFDGVEAGPSRSSRPKRAAQVESTCELPYDRDGLVRAVRYDQDGARIPALPRPLPLPGVIGNIHAAAAETGNQPLGKLLYDRKSAAHTLSISVRSLDYLIARKQLAFRRVGRKVLIPRGELLRFASKDHFEAIAS
jgi:hypothetical protein